MTFTAAEQLRVILWIKNDVALGINSTTEKYLITFTSVKLGEV